MMKNRFLLLISLFLVQSVFAQQDAGFYFYSQEDMNNIKSSSKTDGTKILKGLIRRLRKEKNILWKYRLWRGTWTSLFLPDS